jgi:hypothetical protein
VASLPPLFVNREAAMDITQEMVKAAQRAEYDYYQGNRLLPNDKFIPTSEPVIRAMLAAALNTVTPPPSTRQQKRSIVYAQPPRRRR